MADDQSNDEPQELEDISGVGASKADALRDAGFESIQDVKEADQDDLAEADGVGNALAARIKADVVTSKSPKKPKRDRRRGCRGRGGSGTRRRRRDRTAGPRADREDARPLRERGATPQPSAERRETAVQSTGLPQEKADAGVLASTPRDAVQAAPRCQGQGPESSGRLPHAESSPRETPQRLRGSLRREHGRPRGRRRLP